MPEILVQYEAEIWLSIGRNLYNGWGIDFSCDIIRSPVGTLLFLCRKGKIIENRVYFFCIKFIGKYYTIFSIFTISCFFNSLYKITHWNSYRHSSCNCSIIDYCHCTLFAISRAIIIGRTKGVMEAAISMGASVKEVI